ncbi:ComEC/Rec2 family competence protein [Cupriavidus sp. IDO]|uniref:ComEC/Rec2 family competence protein n=1 Tax=Cupriavidus sp. IDO TaxID=1539142 RepID=UPI000A47721D
MRLILLAFVAGCWTLQQKADLPPATVLRVLACVIGTCALCLAGWRRRLPVRALAIALAFASGFGWAAWRSEMRMHDWLAPTLEAQDLGVRGVVSGLPAWGVTGARFAFTIEHAAGNLHLPPRIVLNWREAPADLRPGQRYRFTVRLRRPRGLANPYGFEYAYWLLAQGYGATGYVRASREGPQEAVHERLAWRIEAQRASIRDHIRAALPADAKFAPVLVALVIGDQRGIDAEDWRLFTRTGIGHLVSISGLHITMIAGMAGALVHRAWRHSFGMGRAMRRPLPLWLPAKRVALIGAVLTALAYGLLAGLQIPALRTVAMLSVAALAVWSGRTPPASMVLAWAAFVAMVLDPWAVMAPGFWLSFGAVAVIFLAAGREEAVTGWWQRFGATLAAAARTQWAVTIGLVPLTLLLFRQVSVVSPLANALAIPVVSLLVTPLALLGAVIPVAVAGPLLGIAHQLMVWLVAAIGWLSEPSWAVWEAARAGWLATVLAAAGVLILLAPAAFGARMRVHGLLLVLPMLVASGDDGADALPRLAV